MFVKLFFKHIFNQIKAALVSIRDFQKHKQILV